MYVIYGFIALLATIIIGILRTISRSKKEDENFYLSAIKWIAAGLDILAILALIEPENDNTTYTDTTALFWLATGMTLAVIALNVVEVVLKAKNLKDERIKEYKKQKSNWD